MAGQTYLQGILQGAAANIPDNYTLPLNAVFGAPSNPTGTSSTTLVMAGLGILITPKVTGRIWAEIWGSVQNTIATDGTQVQLRYGTGSAPANGATVAGSAFNAATQIATSATASAYAGLPIGGVVSGLTNNTQYWVDVAFESVTAGTSSLINMAYIVAEI